MRVQGSFQPYRVHSVAQAHLDAGFAVWRDDHLNGKTEWLDAKVLAARGESIRYYGYLNLDFKGPGQEGLEVISDLLDRVEGCSISLGELTSVGVSLDEAEAAIKKGLSTSIGVRVLNDLLYGAADRIRSQLILYGMARAFFASAWADAAEAAGESIGGEILDAMPAYLDPAALEAARALYRKVEEANEPMNALFAACEASPPGEYADRALEPELFGHYLAMQAMGHGVGLESFGSAVRERVKVPHHEFSDLHLEFEYFKDPVRAPTAQRRAP